MQCMKCGREIPAGNVFCEECLGEMEKYPVKPGTVAIIPHQPKPTVKRTAERRVHTVEQQLAVSRRLNRILSFVLTITLALLIGVSALAVSMLQETEELPLGQNYSTVEDDDDVSRETEKTRR